MGFKMKCKKVKILISGYLDTSLEEENKKDFLKHIEGCQSCREELESTKNLLEMFSEIRPVEKASSFYKSIMDNFYLKRANMQHETGIIESIRSLFEVFRRPVMIGICGAALLAVIVVYSNFFSREEQVALNEDEIEFLLEEHALFAEQKLFSGGAYTTVLASETYYQEKQEK